VRVSVTATNAGGKATAASAASAEVGGLPPRNVEPPTATAKAGIKVAGTLGATPGRWTGTAPLKHTYRWQRCDRRGVRCTDVPGADKQTYALKAEDVNGAALRAPLRVVVTTTNTAGTAEAASIALGAVANAATAGGGAGGGTAKKKKVPKSKVLATVRRVSLASTGRLRIALVCPRKARGACGVIGSATSGKRLRQRVAVNGLARGKSVTRRYTLTAAQRRALRGKRTVTFVLRLAAPATPTYPKLRRVKVKVPAALRRAVRKKVAATPL
jgi:hypothetical protein